MTPAPPPNPSLALKFRRVPNHPEERWELIPPAGPPLSQPEVSPITPHPVPYQYQYPCNQYVSYQYPSYQYPVLSIPQANGIKHQEHWPTFPNNFPSTNLTFPPVVPINDQQPHPKMMTTYPQGYSSYSTYQS